MHCVLSLQDDFREEEPLVQSIIESAGHVCLFLSRFHCELNPIEMLWGYGKYCACMRDSDLQNIGIWLMGDLQLQNSLSHSALIPVILSLSASSSERLGDILMLSGISVLILEHTFIMLIS